MTEQLFKIKPDINIIKTLLPLYGINDFNDNHLFTKNDLIELNTVQKLNEISYKLKEYYLPCKAKIYTTNINEKRAITILRQFLKYYNYTLSSKEKYINGKKYNCHYINKKNIDKKNINDKRKIIINFNI
tara:strand:+ start:491 stop:880 length:390 start_codon:yes stop_codon:yes gene_type:complete